MRCFGQVLPLGGQDTDLSQMDLECLGIPTQPPVVVGGERGSSAEIDKYWINGLTILLCAA